MPGSRSPPAAISASSSPAPAPGLSEIIGVLGALIILLFAFRTFVAAPLPVTTAIVALACGLAIVGLAGHVIDVPSIAPTLGIMLGPGGRDRLLPVHHQQALTLPRARESSPTNRSRAPSATSGSAVVFAGCTVIIALLCLYFSGIPLVRSLGYTTAMVVATAVLAAITFLPAILGAARQADPQAAVPLRRAQARRRAPGWLVQVGRRDPESPSGRRPWSGIVVPGPDRASRPRPPPGRGGLRPAADRHHRAPGL